jgi:hypothetical protein
LSDKIEELDEDLEMTSQEKLDELIHYANSIGYLFTDIASAAKSSVDDNKKVDGLTSCHGRPGQKGTIDVQ